MVVDAHNGRALGTPDYKYGLRVIVVGSTAAPHWTHTERGLELGNLRAFGWVHFTRFAKDSDWVKRGRTNLLVPSSNQRA
jgi:DUF917 family protein